MSVLVSISVANKLTISVSMPISVSNKQTISIPVSNKQTYQCQCRPNEQGQCQCQTTKQCQCKCQYNCQTNKHCQLVIFNMSLQTRERRFHHEYSYTSLLLSTQLRTSWWLQADRSHVCTSLHLSWPDLTSARLRMKTTWPLQKPTGKWRKYLYFLS